jgi:hypothetical protein
MPKQGEIPTRTAKRPKPEGSTSTESVRPSKRLGDCSGPGTYKEALTDVKIAVFKENYPKGKLTE